MCKRTKKTKKQTRREKFAKRISTFLLAILFLSNFFTFQIPVAQADAVGPNPYSINIVGQIKDSATNNALSNVTVKLLSRDPIDWYLYYDNEGNITDNDCVPDEYFEYYQKGEWCYSVQKTTVSDVGGNYLLNNVHACNLSSPHEWYYDLEFSKDGYSVKTIEDIDEICGITITKNETLIPNEIVPDWRKNILPGDILYDQFASGVGHVGLYIGDGWVIEALGVPFWESGYPGKVEESPITAWDYPQRDTVYLLRVKKPNGMEDNIWDQKKQTAIAFAFKQYTQKKPYDWSWYQKQLSIDSPSWYCSELVWAAYYNQDVDLEYRTNGLVFDLLDPVSPVEIFDDEDTEQINSHLEGFDSTPWYRQFAPLFVLSPVNVKITDKDGNVLDENSNNIPNATFIEDQVDANGHKYSIIYLPAEQGPYQIEVTRKPDAQNGDTYSLKTQTEEGDSWLIQDWPVPEVDMSDKYNFPYSNSNFVGFSDTEEITNNTYQAGTLDLVLNSENDFAPKITPTIPSLKNITVENQGSLDFQYKIRVENINGNLDLCSELNLSDFNLATTTLLTGTNDNLNFTANLANNDLSLQNKTCAFDLVFTSWQKNLTDENSGFFDKETISNVVESDEWGDENVGVVLNEFLPNPDGEEYGFDFGIDTSIKPQGEWIELYNNSNNTVDLTGYYLTDASGDRIDIESCRTNTGDVQILSHGYLVVYRSAGGTCNSHNFELNNDGDTIYFYNSLDELQDTTNYTGNDYCDLEPTPGEENDETGSGTCSGVPPNKSYARIPDGVGAWVDPIPTPGKTNSIQEQAVIPNDL